MLLIWGVHHLQSQVAIRCLLSVLPTQSKIKLAMVKLQISRGMMANLQMIQLIIHQLLQPPIPGQPIMWRSQGQTLEEESTELSEDQSYQWPRSDLQPQRLMQIELLPYIVDGKELSSSVHCPELLKFREEVRRQLQQRSWAVIPIPQERLWIFLELQLFKSTIPSVIQPNRVVKIEAL